MTDGTELYSLNENVWVKLYGVSKYNCICMPIPNIMDFPLVYHLKLTQLHKICKSFKVNRPEPNNFHGNEMNTNTTAFRQ